MNWSAYSTFVGDVFGAPLALEALLAFFLESTFIGLWIFGWDRLPQPGTPGLHLGGGDRVQPLRVLHPRRERAGCGTRSAYEVDRGDRPGADIDRHRRPCRRINRPGLVARTSPTGVVSPPRFVTRPLVRRSFVVAGLYMITSQRRPADRDATGRRSAPACSAARLRAGLLVTAVAGASARGLRRPPGQARRDLRADEARRRRGAVGHRAGRRILAVRRRRHPGRRNHINVQLPSLLSFLATGDVRGHRPGHQELQAQYDGGYGPGDYRPNIAVLYWSFRLMMGLGMAGVGIAVLGFWLTRRGRPCRRPSAGCTPSRSRPARGAGRRTSSAGC